MFLEENITSIKGIGEKTALLFSKASVFCVKDLLTYFPRNYISMPAVTDICHLKDKGLGAVCVTVTSSPVIFGGKGRSTLSFSANDKSGIIKIYYFGMPYIKNQIKRGMTILFCGQVAEKNGSLFMSNPKIYTPEEYRELQGRLIPVYPLTKGLGNNKVRTAIREVVNNAPKINDFIPEEIRNKYGYQEINEALYKIHFPQNMEEVTIARKRLALNEFLMFLYNVELLKENNCKIKSHIIIEDKPLYSDFYNNLPFSLTQGQIGALKEISEDLKSGYAMNRLLEGDVGSGKTIIALLSAYKMVLSGFQTALMAPTVVLARQHYEDVVKLTSELGLKFKPVLLTGALTAKEKREALKSIKNGEYNIIIGTQALFSENVEFANLGLCICDEQHRFGVKQRVSLLEKGKLVHMLVMSATPIPRTLGLILYGDMDISVIEDKPAKRVPIKNAVVGNEYHFKNLEFIRARVNEGQQAYVICPMIEEGDSDSLKDVESYSSELQEYFGNEVRVDFLYGKMNTKEKNSVMERFKNHEFDVLVSTTVVEVGVNVPNATVIMIENCERFGLAQLHQLRGRVGRGSLQSYAIFVTDSKVKKNMERLSVLASTNDGFKIASEDLKQRGPGDFFGLRQSGDPLFKTADIYTDADVLRDAKDIITNCFDILKTLYSKTDDVAFFYFVDNRFLCL